MQEQATVPRVTVLMSVFNEEQRVKSALEGILNQDFTNFEFLIIDDGSTDKTVEVVGEYRDSRLIVLQEDRKGLSAALNVGLKAARGELVARQDGDDISERDRLSKQVAFLDMHPDVALVGSGVTVVDDKHRILGEYHYPSDHETLVAWLHRLLNPLPHSTVMFRRKAVLELGGYREIFRKAQDYDLHLRIIDRHRIASVEEPLCRLRHSLESATFGDEDSEQLRYAMLAYLLAVVRREKGADLLDIAAWPKALTEFENWFNTSTYRRQFRAAKARRAARIAWGSGHFGSAAVAAGNALAGDPGWIVRQLNRPRSAYNLREFDRWIHTFAARLD